MLGALTSKACYYTRGACSLGTNDWRYNIAGASGVVKDSMGVVTAGYVVTNIAHYYHSGIMQTSTVTAVGSRFPWTTGSVTVTARGYPHATVHYAQGFDNRNTTTPSGKGTIQLVTPLLTKWFGYEITQTVGVGILRIKFIPEPQTWMMLLAGASLLGVGYRLRGR